MMIALGGHRFPSKSAAERHIRGILLRNGPAPRCDVSQPLDGADLAFVLALLEAHPRRHTVVDCGIATIHVQELSPGVRRFLIRRRDGSVRDFSWRRSLTPLSQAQRVARVCRHYVKDQKEAFRLSRPALVKCALCGRPAARADAHVDHEAPWTFQRLVESWADSLRIDLDDIELIDKPGYGEETVFADAFLAGSWEEYHELNARLRLLCSKCNLSLARKQESHAA